MHKNLKELTDFQPIYCPKCGSIDIVKCGHRYTRYRKIQRYRCNSCNNKEFDLPFARVKSPIKLVQYVIALQEQMSCRQLERHLKEMNITLSHTTIGYWRTKFNPDNKRILANFSKNRVKDYRTGLPILQTYKGRILKANKIKRIFGYSRQTFLAETFIVRNKWADSLGNGFYFVNGVSDEKA